MKKRRFFIVLLILSAAGLMVVYSIYAQKQQEIAFQPVALMTADTVLAADAVPVQKEVAFRQIIRRPVGLKPGDLVFHIAPNKEVFTPKLLPPDGESNFWVMGTVGGGIVRLNRSGTVVCTVQPPHGVLPWPSVNSSGYLALSLLKISTQGMEWEIVTCTPKGQKLGGFKVKGCPQCGHLHYQTMVGLDNKGRIWLQFLSSNLPLDEDPKQTACAVAFDQQGKIVRHIEGPWGLSAGLLWRRTKSRGGSFIILDPETMERDEIPVPSGWQGFLVG